jgi:hypothetical protein
VRRGGGLHHAARRRLGGLRGPAGVDVSHGDDRIERLKVEAENLGLFSLISRSVKSDYS